MRSISISVSLSEMSSCVLRLCDALKMFHVDAPLISTEMMQNSVNRSVDRLPQDDVDSSLADHWPGVGFADPTPVRGVLNARGHPCILREHTGPIPTLRQSLVSARPQ